MAPPMAHGSLAILTQTHANKIAKSQTAKLSIKKLVDLRMNRVMPITTIIDKLPVRDTTISIV